jgi:hypothetical protein
MVELKERIRELDKDTMDHDDMASK